MPSVLVVDDDQEFQAAVAELVRGEGFTVESAGSLADARAIFEVRIPDVVLVGLALPDGNGLELLSAVEGPGAPETIVVAGRAMLDDAIEALRHGASDYLEKPLDPPRLRAILMNVARRRDMTGEIEGLRAALRGLGRFGALIGGAPVLVQGESGTGKELVAETVHELGRRRTRPFVAGDEIGPQQLPAATPVGAAAAEIPADDAAILEVKVGSSIAEAERRLILATIDACEGRKDQAAKILGISLKTLYNRLNSYRSVPGPAA